MIKVSKAVKIKVSKAVKKLVKNGNRHIGNTKAVNS